LPITGFKPVAWVLLSIHRTGTIDFEQR